MATLSPTGKRAIDDLIAQTIAAKKLPGFVYGVSNIDEEIYFEGGGPNVFGDPSSGEVGPDSIMWICSQTKMIASLAALKIFEQGKITFDTPVGDYLPEFRNPIIVDSTSTQKTTFKPAETVVTFKHLLTFTSGLFYPVSTSPLPHMAEGYSSKEIHKSGGDPASQFFQAVIGELPALPLKFEPGTDFVYGWSADALGFLVEKISGKTLEQFCQEYIFGPLGMQASFFLTPEFKERAVNLTFRDENGTLHPWANQVKIIEQDHTKVRVFLGGVGVYTSMRDYLKLLRHLLQIHAGREVPNAILKKEIVDDIFVPVLPEKAAKSLSESTTIEGLSWSTALAICTVDWPGRRRKGSAFWGGWAGTGGFIDPTTGIAAVFGVQVTPSKNMEVHGLMAELESTLYEALKNGS
ncbi:beta-lactamase [Phlegmacium glaucopus]|nr:beta-lactamase [Phlegmacium glaucopus]